MRRITISLPDELAQVLEREARSQGMSASAIARQALMARLGLGEGEARELPFAGLGHSGARDTASRAEEILAREWDPAGDR